MMITPMTVDVQYCIRQRYILSGTYFSFNLNRVLETKTTETRRIRNIFKRSVSVPKEKQLRQPCKSVAPEGLLLKEIKAGLKRKTGNKISL